MPIFQDPDRQRFYDQWSDDHPSIRGEEIPPWVRLHQRHWEPDTSGRGTKFSNEAPLSDRNLSDMRACDREELIHYIKHADTSAWEHRLVRLFRLLEERKDLLGNKRKKVSPRYAYAYKIYEI
jgi:hypothetical protein